MSLDLFKMRFPDPASQDLIEIINSSAQRGADMVRQVLSFARGVEGRRIALHVGNLLQDIQKIANDTFLKHIDVRISISPDLWSVPRGHGELVLVGDDEASVRQITRQTLEAFGYRVKTFPAQTLHRGIPAEDTPGDFGGESA